ncbi:restriction endonuclease subunit S [Algoriphagus boritolerans]|uniref:restriction endonuclease subunit S n=1 Tax=Algoriphagus boritolerans TaxID=308111 RepID=UPI002FCDFF8F
MIQQDAKAEQNLLVESGDIAYNMMRMWQGAYGVSETTCMVSPAYVVVKPKKNNLSIFFSYLFERSRSRYLFTIYSHGLTLDRLRLYPNDFLSIPVASPSLPEQQKIAEFLTAVDRRIELLQYKKEKLEAYKKGVMQKIFAKKLRFKADDGSEFPDWEEKKLGEVGKTFNGLTGKSKENFGKGKPYIQYKQIFDSSEIKIEGFGLVEVSENEFQSKVQKGDVFFTTSSETPREIGMASVLTNDVREVYLNSFCFGYRPNSIEKLLPEFSRYFFRSPIVRKGIVKLAQGSTRYNMSKVELMRLSFEIPSPKEQLKIAKFLTSLDRSIENLNQQINHTQTWKKGLLQKMFV